jgi:hypothetical protein
MMVDISDSYIAVLEDDGLTEVVSWHVDEWSQDFEIVPSIANAIRLAYIDPQQLRDLLMIIKPV